jgi:large conductance mechanosensitive channel
MRKFFDEFKKFIMRGNVVDLAVGLVIGAAFTGIVNSLVKDIFMPIIGLITGGFDVSNQVVGYKDARIGWGSFVQMIINFVIIGFCLFLVVKAMNRLMKREDNKPPEPTATEKLLVEIRDLLARGAAPASPAIPTPPVP